MLEEEFFAQVSGLATEAWPSFVLTRFPGLVVAQGDREREAGVAQVSFLMDRSKPG